MGRKYFDEVEKTRLLDRKIDELMGIAQALASKPSLDDADISLLDRWMSANDQIADEPLVTELFESVDELLRNPAGAPSKDDVLRLIKDLAGEVGTDGTMRPSSLPINKPPPQIDFQGKRYCFTGTFAFGTRSDCEAAVLALGATTGPISTRTNFLVVGSSATEGWKHAAFGNKIMQAVTWRDVDGHDIAIITEADWRAALEEAVKARVLHKRAVPVPDWRETEGILTATAPTIEFVSKKFCFTGGLRCGTRTDCEEAIALRGGEFSDSVTVDTNYLVVGMERGDWSESVGSKIRRAMAINANGPKIAIVREEDWLRATIAAPFSSVQGRLATTQTAIERRIEDLRAAAGCDLHPEAKLKLFAEALVSQSAA